jgi:hypothetical protein
MNKLQMVKLHAPVQTPPGQLFFQLLFSLPVILGNLHIAFLRIKDDKTTMSYG